jgi:large subunit ribosomal protein L9
MEVILIKDVEKIGNAGTVVKVKEGFARNFLIPKCLAVLLTPANLKKIEQDKLKKDLELQNKKKECEKIAEKLSNLSLTIQALTHEEGKLYANIGSRDISDSLKEEGIEIDKDLIMLEEPIKSLGIYEILIKLHPDVPAKLKVWIVNK